MHPVSLAIAQLAGRIEGEQAARGISTAVEDLIIGATALHLGFDVVTLNMAIDIEEIEVFVDREA